MAMQQEYIHLVTRLKQQPRLGMGVFEDAASALNNLFKGYTQGYQDVVRNNAFGYLAKQAQDAYDKVNILEERNDALRQGFSASTKQSALLGYQFDALAKKIGVNAQKLKDYAVELNSILPGRAAFIGSIKDENSFTGKLAKTTEVYRNKLGIATDTVAKFYKNQVLLGKDAASGFKTSEEAILKIAKKYEGEYQGVYTDLIEGLGGVDAEVAATFGRMPEKLAEAVIKTKKLGIELSSVLAVGDQMLDVESAIANEIELQILGGESLNVQGITQARLSGDALALTEELTKFVKANGEQFKENPFLLDAAATATGMQKADLLEMYSQLQLNKQVEKDTTDEVAKRNQRNAEMLKAYADERGLLVDNLSLQQRAEALESKQTELDKQQDKAQQNLTESILKQYGSPEAYAKQVTDLATNATKISNDLFSASENLVSAIGSSDMMSYLYGAGSVIKSFTDIYNLLKGGGTTETNFDDALGGTKKSDVFIPAGGDSTVVSGPFGSFTLDSRDDVLAAPGIRDAVAGGGGNATAIASAIVSALQGMSFHVNNVFDGDKIASSLQIRRGQNMNNLGNIA